MLEFCKNELKKQNDLTFVLINVPNDDNLRQLSQLIINQKALLASLILEIESPYSLYASFFTDKQTKIKAYYNDYSKQQILLAALGLGNYLPPLNPLQSEMPNIGTEEFHFFDNPFFLTPPYHNSQPAPIGNNGNNLVASDIAPRQRTNQLTVTNSPAFFSSRAEQPLSASVSIDTIKPAKDSALLQKNTRKSIGSERKQQHASKNQEKTIPETKQEKSRAAARNHRKRQNEYAQNLTDQVNALQVEEQELINKINQLKVENMELRKRQQYLRGFLTHALTNNTSSTGIEESSLNTQFSI